MTMGLRAAWVSLLAVLCLVASCTAQPVWSGYGGYPAGWGSPGAPAAVAPAPASWHTQRPYYEQYLAMGGVYSPTHTQYIPYYVPYVTNSL